MQHHYHSKEIDYSDFTLCPEDYKQYVIKILSVQAYAENRGAVDVGSQLKLAPDFRARLGLAKIAHDEAVHAAKLYSILEKIGVSESEAIDIAEGKHERSTRKSSSLAGVEAVGDDENCWLDIVLNNLLMDGAGTFMVDNFSKSSFKPWAIACEEIAIDEKGHRQFGLIQFKKILAKSSESVNDEFSKWYVRALNFFGPANTKSAETLKNYGIKLLSNDELRENFKFEIQSLVDKEFSGKIVLPDITNTYPYQILSNAVEEVAI